MLRADEWRLRMSENVNNVLAKLKGAASSTAAKYTSLQDNINRTVGRGAQGIKSGLGGAWQGAKASVREYSQSMLSSLPLPGAMGNALGALAGPLGIAVGLTAALGLGMVKGVQAAERLGVPFRELRNLNLDKTDQELADLKGRILDLSAAKGLDPVQLTQGIYDAQSTIGQFGPGVEAMVARVGVASRALNMDFTGAVNGMSKALVQFKMPMSELDALIASNAKTVQVGVVSFDQLAKVQTEYAGAAASSGQKLDAANKVFSLLTVNTKNADIAATYAKAAFIDLGKSDTLKGFKKLGVEVYDANGNMRQADTIIRDLVPLLGKMTDVTFANFKEELKGTEGLNALLDYTKASGSEVLRVLDGFDGSSFNLDKAIKTANGDLDVMKDKLQNQLNTELTRLGELMMPMVVGIVAGLSSMVKWINQGVQSLASASAWFKDLYAQSAIVRAVVEGLFLSMKTAWLGITTIISNSFTLMKGAIKGAGQILSGDFSGAWDTIKGTVGDSMDGFKKGFGELGDNASQAWRNTVDKPKSITATVDTSQLGAQLDGLGAPVAMTGKQSKPEFSTMPQVLQEAGSTLEGLQSPGAKVPQAPTIATDPFAGKFGAKKKGDSEHAGTTGAAGGTQQRNVTVTIQKLVGEMKIYVSSVKDGGVEIKKQVEEALIRAVQGTELAVAND